MRKFIRDNLVFILVCAVIVGCAIALCLSPPDKSLLREIGKMLGQILGDFVEEFKEGMKK